MIWLYNSKSEVVIQLRRAKHANLDDLWDFSASGHITSEQNVIDAAMREVKEELGLNLNKKLLKKVLDYKHSSKYNLPNGKEHYNNEYFRVFIYELHSVPKFILQKEEVNDVKFISISALESELRDKEKVKKYVYHGDYWFRVLDIIKSELKK